jgi:uncharacterized protein YggE
MKQSVWALALVLPCAAVAQNVTPPQRTITVSATATVEREPERAVLLLAVESTGTTAQQAAQANATRMDALIAALKQLRIAGPLIRTTAYELHPEYANERPQPAERPGPPRIVGYRAVNMVQVIIDSVPRVGAVIDGAIRAGANRVADLRFELKDPQAARAEALRLAVARARSEAESTALAAGQRLGPPLTITTHGQPQPMDRMAMARAAEAVPTPIEAGTLTVAASVTITYRLVGN